MIWFSEPSKGLSCSALTYLHISSFDTITSLSRSGEVSTWEPMYSNHFFFNMLLNGLLRHTSSGCTLLVHPPGIKILFLGLL